MILLMGALFSGVPPLWADAPHPSWAREFPKTDFSNTTIDYADILSGGPPRDGIPAINDPKFVKIADIQDLTDTDPVIGIVVNDIAKAYTLRILIWHEIVNDTIGGVPVAVTYCLYVIQQSYSTDALRAAF